MPFSNLNLPDMVATNTTYEKKIVYPIFAIELGVLSLATVAMYRFLAKLKQNDTLKQTMTLIVMIFFVMSFFLLIFTSTGLMSKNVAFLMIFVLIICVMFSQMMGVNSVVNSLEPRYGASSAGDCLDRFLGYRHFFGSGNANACLSIPFGKWQDILSTIYIVLLIIIAASVHTTETKIVTLLIWLLFTAEYIFMQRYNSILTSLFA